MDTWLLIMLIVAAAAGLAMFIAGIVLTATRKTVYVGLTLAVLGALFGAYAAGVLYREYVVEPLINNDHNAIAVYQE
jgi:hypothetical protein